MKIVGIDASLTGTAIARYDDGTVTLTMVPTDKLRGMERLDAILNEVRVHIRESDLVLIEGYAHGRANQAHQLGELGGVLRYMLYKTHVKYLDVAPGKLKKFATGKGNASKPQMLTEAVRRLGYDGYSDDEADALWLLQMGLHLLEVDDGNTKTALPKVNLSTLKEVELP